MRAPCISNSNLERLTIMKKIYIAIAVLAAAVLASCQREQSFDDRVFGENEVAFTLTPGGATRAATIGSPNTKGVTVDLGKVGNRNLFIEETITDLNAVSPSTRGIPVYTQNVGYLENFDLAVNVPSAGDATYDKLDSEVYGEGTNIGWRYSHNYASSIWPSPTATNQKVEFYFRMPANMSATGNGVSSLTYSGGKTSFSYTSPATAEGQQDIIFSYVKITKQEHKDALPGGYPVTFQHALSGIKFAIANELTERTKYGIKVTGLSFIGLKSSGDCDVTTTYGEDNVPVTTVVWKNLSGAADNAMTQTFVYGETDGNDKYVKTYTQPGEGEADPNHFGSTFYSGGTSQNLNDEKASYTFWVIPQNVANNENAKLRISYEMNGVKEYMDVPLSVIAKKAWDPGQLRTFTFKLDDVNVKIEDTVTPKGNQTNAYQGSVKNNPIATNTGNKDAYIRAAIVGQWWDNRDPENPAIVFGFRDEVNNLYLVESWYQDQFVNKDKKHGEFVDLAAYDKTNGYNGWTLCEDGYYYYTSIVTPEPADADPNAESKPWQTKPLFTSYTLKTPPQAIDPITLGVLPAGSLYFTLEIATQAISASDPSKLDGTNFSDWKAAWANADANKTAPVPVQ